MTIINHRWPTRRGVYVQNHVFFFSVHNDNPREARLSIETKTKHTPTMTTDVDMNPARKIEMEMLRPQGLIPPPQPSDDISPQDGPNSPVSATSAPEHIAARSDGGIRAASIVICIDAVTTDRAALLTGCIQHELARRRQQDGATTRADATTTVRCSSMLEAGRPRLIRSVGDALKRMSSTYRKAPAKRIGCTEMQDGNEKNTWRPGGSNALNVSTTCAATAARYDDNAAVPSDTLMQMVIDSDDKDERLEISHRVVDLMVLHGDFHSTREAPWLSMVVVGSSENMVASVTYLCPRATQAVDFRQVLSFDTCMDKVTRAVEANGRHEAALEMERMMDTATENWDITLVRTRGLQDESIDVSCALTPANREHTVHMQFQVPYDVGYINRDDDDSDDDDDADSSHDALCICHARIPCRDDDVGSDIFALAATPDTGGLTSSDLAGRIFAVGSKHRSAVSMRDVACHGIAVSIRGVGDISLPGRPVLKGQARATSSHQVIRMVNGRQLAPTPNASNHHRY